MRGRGVPAIKFSHLFDVVDMLPIQLKHNSETNAIDTKIGLDYVQNTDLQENECILLVEGNHKQEQKIRRGINPQAMRYPK